MRMKPALVMKYMYQEDYFSFISGVYIPGYMYGRNYPDCKVLVLDDMI